jgi:cytochrome P450
MTTAEPLTAQVLFERATWADPYPVYARLLAHSPLPAQGRLGPTWVLLSYAHVYGALRDHTTFASSLGNPGEFILLRSDPPRHTQLRTLVNKAFTPRRIAGARPWVQAIVTELLDDLDDGPVDVVTSLTGNFPARVIARLLGVPDERSPAFQRWAAALSATTLDPAERAAVQQEVFGFFREQVAEQRSEDDDLVAALVTAEIDGERLDETDVLRLCEVLMVGGSHTTTSLLSNALNLLADQPALWARLRNDRALVEPFIDEVLRYESPVQHLMRRVTRAVEVGGVMIPAGTIVWLALGAANRDPAEFPDPDAFRLDRDLQRHLAFAHGIHYCFGAPLARLEAEVAFRELVRRFPRIELAGEPVRRPTFTLRGLASLPVAV